MPNPLRAFLLPALCVSAGLLIRPSTQALAEPVPSHRAAVTDIRITEIAAAPSDRLLNWTEEGPRLGPSRMPAWTEVEFDDSNWESSGVPIGFGVAGLEADLSGRMKDKVPSLYLRHRFDVSEENAALSSLMSLKIRFDDGFIATINGKEVARSRTGTPPGFFYHDQPAYQEHDPNVTETIPIGAASDYLQPGENVLAIQVHTKDLIDRSITDGDLFFDASLEVQFFSTLVLVPMGAEWVYWVGEQEPSGGLMDEDLEFSDWLELANLGTETISLQGWSLTDDPRDPRKWTLPDISLDPGEYRVVFASGKDRSDPSGPLHTNFGLGRDGEYLALFPASQPFVPVSAFDPAFPKQDPFYTYGLLADGSSHAYFARPTPGEANPGTGLSKILGKPDFNYPSGVYTDLILVTLTSDDLGASIRYTLDGSEPTLKNGFDYGNPLIIADNAVVRARAFREGSVPSGTKTRSYIYRLDYKNYEDTENALRTLPILSIVGDEERSLYEPHGVMSVMGGHYVDGLIFNRNREHWWEPVDPEDYNNALYHGRAFERPVAVNYIEQGGGGFSADAGLRMARSNVQRGHFTRDDTWDTAHKKWSTRIYFRGDYGESTLDYPLYDPPGADEIDVLAVRTARMWDNPMVEDELIRRLLADTGQVVSRGNFVNLFLNGGYRAYMNLIERVDEGFFQLTYESDNDWDVLKAQITVDIRRVTEIMAGDRVEYDRMLSFARTRDMSNYANYTEFGEMFDIDYFIDYLLVNVYSGPVDWPLHNWIAARERVPGARFRYYSWDADFTFWDNYWVSYVHNFMESRLEGDNNDVSEIYRRLKRSPEFRLLWRDHVQRLFFNGGALTEEHILMRLKELEDTLEPMIQFQFREPFYDYIETEYIPNRQEHMLDHMEEFNLWDSDFLAPRFSQHGGSVPAGTSITIQNPNPSGAIYYTVDGSDPRTPGTGDPSPSAFVYSSGILVGESMQLKARVLGTAWSPLVEAVFAVEGSTADVVLSEIQYNSPDGPEWEFVELHNPSATDTVDLGGVELADAVRFAFPFGTSLEPGGYIVVADLGGMTPIEDFRAYYGLGPAVRIVGPYDGNLSDGGEQLEVKDALGGAIEALTWSDTGDWPEEADGNGLSLNRLSMDQGAGLAANWAARTPTPGSAIAGANGLPLLGMYQDAGITQGRAWTIPPSSPPSDPEGELETVVVQPASLPSGGAIEVDPLTGVVTVTPDASPFAEDYTLVVEVTAIDSLGLRSSRNFALSVMDRTRLAEMIVPHLLGRDPIPEVLLPVADFNGDGGIDAAEVLAGRL